MAVDTDIALQNQVIYSIYVRNHTPEGTFCAVMSDLDRIRALGTDIIWFMPIHPIGEKGKKGSLGCPYANRDYRTVNPYYGTMEDFRALVATIHARSSTTRRCCTFSRERRSSTRGRSLKTSICRACSSAMLSTAARGVTSARSCAASMR